jgi:phage-related protein
MYVNVTKGRRGMRKQIETAEISDAELDNVSGGVLNGAAGEVGGLMSSVGGVMSEVGGNVGNIANNNGNGSGNVDVGGVSR